MPRTFLIGGNSSVRGIALDLEQLALRENALRARVQEGEFGVQAIVGALADGLVVADGRRRIRLMNHAFREMFGIRPEATDGTLARDGARRGRRAIVRRNPGPWRTAARTRSRSSVLRKPNFNSRW